MGKKIIEKHINSGGDCMIGVEELAHERDRERERERICVSCANSPKLPYLQYKHSSQSIQTNLYPLEIMRTRFIFKDRHTANLQIIQNKN